jgi:hypothetical protein
MRATIAEGLRREINARTRAFIQLMIQRMALAAIQ